MKTKQERQDAAKAVHRGAQQAFPEGAVGSGWTRSSVSTRVPARSEASAESRWWLRCASTRGQGVQSLSLLPVLRQFAYGRPKWLSTSTPTRRAPSTKMVISGHCEKCRDGERAWLCCARWSTPR